MKESVAERATKIIEPIVTEMGYVLVDVTYRKEVAGMTLWVCIDKDGGVTINDCEAVSHALDDPLDIEDITNGASYNLNVSSYGLDRVFKTAYDYNKHLGQAVVVKFYQPWQGSKVINAILVGFDDKTVTIEYNNQQYSLDKKQIVSVQKYIEF